ncbi:hypothetical protein [Crocosphaera sp. Alani8]|uniref:hypothetical protein n=1 Tax=Crocosphaera sp. Alani8 TaxID=3038952 RepID=UPI00313C2A4C
MSSLVWVQIGEVDDLKLLQAMIGVTIIACFQALVLSRFMPHPWLWILSTFVAWLLMGESSLGLIGWFAPRTELTMVRLTTGLMLGGTAGLWIGCWQWFILKSFIHKSYLWIFISSITWSFALSGGWMVGGILHSITHLFLGEVIGLVLVWTLVGMQTGIALSYLLKK